VLGAATVKSMFGGYGFYCDGLFFALYDKQHVWLKVDGQTRPAFEARGLPAFQPFDGQPLTMKYHRAPEEMLEHDDALREWAGAAIEVARRSAKPKKPRASNAKATR
jgi:DNA transformation protein